MYPNNPGHGAGWNPNAPNGPQNQQNNPQQVQQQPSNQQQGTPQQQQQGTPQHSQAPPSQQSPAQWSPQPTNGSYAPPRQTAIAPISQPLPSGPAMQTLQPPLQHDQYRSLPPPQQMYAQPGYPGGPPPMQYAPPQQPAPRQRTAIACRYCRRRKIRCTGFESSEDGRCTNCHRFQQECIFTPVSAQTQAFVPAHAAYRGNGPPQGTQLYGAFGQPLPQNGNRESYPPQQQQPQGQQQQGQYPPPPPGYTQPAYSPQPGDKRSNDEPHTPTLPPPPPGMNRDGYYSDPPGLNGHDHRDTNGDHAQRMGEMRHEYKDAGTQVVGELDLPKPDTSGKEQAS